MQMKFLNNIIMKDKILHIKNRASMYIGENDYHNICCFITGIFVWSDFNYEFNYWLYTKYKTPRNICWEASILHFLAKDDEILAIEKLFENLIIFLDERGYPILPTKSYSLNGVSAPEPEFMKSPFSPLRG